MQEIVVTENAQGRIGIEYIKNGLIELSNRSFCRILAEKVGERLILKITCEDNFYSAIKSEVIDKIAEVIAIKYKYDYFSRTVKVSGLDQTQKEILLASLIAADLDSDKKYCIGKLKEINEIAIDGTFNFRLKTLKRKWEEVSGYMPTVFISSQLKDFITFLLEDKKEKVYIDEGKVYDSHYKRLKRCNLLGGEGIEIIREVLLSNCGRIELTGKVPETDEKYLKEYYGGKINF